MFKKLREKIKVFKFIINECYKQAKFETVAVLVSAVIISIFPVLITVITGSVIDILISIFQKNGDLSLILIPLSLYVLVSFFSAVVKQFDAYVFQAYNLKENRMNGVLYNSKLLDLDPQTLQDPNFAKDTTTMRWNMSEITEVPQDLYDFINKLTTTILNIFLLLTYNWLFVLLLVVSEIPKMATQRFFGQRIWTIWSTNSSEKILYEKNESSICLDSEHINEVKIMNTAKYFLNKCINLAIKFEDKIIDNEKKRLLASLLSTVIEYIFVGITVVLVANHILNGNLSVGSFVIILTAIWKFKDSFAGFLARTVSLNNVYPVLESFHRFMHRESIIKDTPNAKLLPRKTPIKIEFKNVWFKYPTGNRWVFNGVSFVIDSDEDVAIVGKNGAGKSTLINLITRIYDPQKGEILINDIPLKKLKRDSFYKHIGILSQNFLFFPTTVEENIFAGDFEKQSRQNKVKDYAKMAEADEFIQKMNDKYKTYLSTEIPNGQHVSGGEKQKIAIARVFYKEPRLLILDEPTSAIDAISEEKIFENIYKFAENRTVVAVSHRFSTVKKASRIIVLEDGKILENGTHDQLMSNKNLYWKMYTAQNKTD